jgi:glycosyltransferase involved in cell wall biosynthesis
MYPRPPYPKVSVVICTLNEAKNLPYVLPYIPDWVDEVVLVDGHSTDGTVEVAKKLRPDVKVFYQPGKGKGEALRLGIKSSNGDIIVTLDADGETDPRDMGRFIEVLLRGFEFVKGSRFRLCLPVGKQTHRMIGNLIIASLFNYAFPYTVY